MKHFHHFASSLIRYSVPTVSHNFPYSTRLVPHPVQCAPSTKCFIQIFQLHPIQFHLLFRTSSAPCCCCLPAPLMLCMINGIKDFDHVDNFYVSWISKKTSEMAKKNSRFIIAQKKFKSIAKENSDVVCASLETSKSICSDDGIFGSSQVRRKRCKNISLSL